MSEVNHNNDTEDYFYERRFPEKDELVMVRVLKIDDMGVMCSLLEYNNMEGFLPLSEISRKRMRSVFNHVRVGQKQVLQVLRVDKEKGFTDLSKKFIAASEREEGKEKFFKGKSVHQIVRRVSQLTDTDIEEVKQMLIYPLEQSTKYETPYDAFQALSLKNEDIFKGFDNVDERVKNALIDLIKKKMSAPVVKIAAEVDVTCYSEGGIDEIKKALNKGLEVDERLNIQLVSSPTFSIWLNTKDEKGGKEKILDSIEAIKKQIESIGGSLEIENEPQVIGKVFDQ